MISCDPKGQDHLDILRQKYLMSVTDGTGQTPCSMEIILFLLFSMFHYAVNW